MRYLPLLLTFLVAACVSTDEQIAARARDVLGPKVVAEFCAMTETQRRAYLLRRLEVANASGGYVRGRYYDTTVVLGSELGAERHGWRKITGC
jgi:hypothetical protein